MDVDSLPLIQFSDQQLQEIYEVGLQCIKADNFEQLKSSIL